MSGEAARRVRVEVPATTANLGAGFDALGLALELVNTIEVEVTGVDGVYVDITGEGADTLPTDSSHLVVQSLFHYYDVIKRERPRGLRLRQEIGVPLKGGLGSSATAVVGGLLAASVLSGVDASVDDILQLACALEGHPDNVAPALLGGLVAAVRTDAGRVCAVSVPVSEGWRPVAVLAVPDFEVNTKDARSVLQETVSLKDAAYNVGRAALFVAAAAAGRTDCLAESMSDRLHQQSRSCLIPGLQEVFNAAMDAGALGVSLSGSGPTILALSESEQARTVGTAMCEAFADAGVKAQVIYTKPRFRGATVEVLETRL